MLHCGWPGELQCLTPRVYDTGNATVGEQWNLPSVWNTKRTWTGKCVVQFGNSLCTDGPSPTKNRGERNMKLRALHQFVSPGPNATWHVNSLIGMGRWITMRRPLYRLISTMRQPIWNHFPFWSLFGLALAALYCLLLYGKKNLLGYWIVAAFTYFKLYNSPRESIDIARNQVSHTASTCRSHRHAACLFPAGETWHCSFLILRRAYASGS